MVAALVATEYRIAAVNAFVRNLLIVTVAAGVACPAPVAAGSPKVRAVLELFTSQGCSTCPPADALMNRLAEDPTLVTLSFAVDYWDYLGWKDTAARPEFTQRQRAYADVRGDRTVYTPQMIVDGRVPVVGSDRAALDKAAGDLEGGKSGLAVDLDVSVGADTITIDLPAAPATVAAGEAADVKVGEATAANNPADPAATGKPANHVRATVWLVLFDRTRTVPIVRGENTGKTITYSHVVRSIQPVGMWKGQATRLELPRHDMARLKGTGCAVLLQIDRGGKPGPILGAAMIPDLST